MFGDIHFLLSSDPCRSLTQMGGHGISIWAQATEHACLEAWLPWRYQKGSCLWGFCARSHHQTSLSPGTLKKPGFLQVPGTFSFCLREPDRSSWFTYRQLAHHWLLQAGHGVWSEDMQVGGDCCLETLSLELPMPTYYVPI